MTYQGRDTLPSQIDAKHEEPIAPLVLSVPQAAKFINLSEATIWRMIRSRELDARKAGRRTLILRESPKPQFGASPELVLQHNS